MIDLGLRASAVRAPASRGLSLESIILPGFWWSAVESAVSGSVTVLGALWASSLSPEISVVSVAVKVFTQEGY